MEKNIFWGKKNDPHTVVPNLKGQVHFPRKRMIRTQLSQFLKEINRDSIPSDWILTESILTESILILSESINRFGPVRFASVRVCRFRFGS